MSTPQSISSLHKPRRPTSPYQTLSFSNRDSSPRAASLARLTQSARTPPQHRSGAATPTSIPLGAPLPQHDFRKIDPVGTYGSIGNRQNTSGLSRQEWLPQEEADPEIIRKYLVSGFGTGSRASTPPVTASNTGTPIAEDEEFNSLQLQGGDITRQVYRFAEQSSRRSSIHQRSHSFSHPVRDVNEETVQDIMVPGGFRRNFLQRTYYQPEFREDGRPTFVARNFLHFLTLYGHFAGEDLEDWEDEPSTTGTWIFNLINDRRGRS